MYPKLVKDLVTRAGQKEAEIAAPSPSLCKIVIKTNLHRSLSVQGGVGAVGVAEAMVGVVRPTHRNQKLR